MAEHSKMAGTSDEAAVKQPYHDASAEQIGDAQTKTHETYWDKLHEQDDARPSRKNDIMIQPEPHGPAQVQLKDPISSSAREDGKKTGDITVDVEKGGISPAPTQTDSREPSEEPVTRKSKIWKKIRPYFHVLIWLIMTGWWIASLILHRPGTPEPKNWVIPFLLWLAITVRLITFYVPVSLVFNPMRWLWRNTVSRGVSMIPEKFRLPLGAIGSIGVMLLGTFVTEASGENSRSNRAISICGLAILLLGMWATSRNRKAINCKEIMQCQMNVHLLTC